MKKFALIFVAVFGLSVAGLTGCGGSKETKVIEAPATTEPDMSPEEQAAFDAAMEKSMSQPGAN